VERHADVPDDVRQAYLASVPAGRMGTPGDIAHAVSFFASISHLDNLTPYVLSITKFTFDSPSS
jgi:NAD(P)-dependent dehydrogenase (short-subunit alcohol dehydrogenase family)